MKIEKTESTLILHISFEEAFRNLAASFIDVALDSVGQEEFGFDELTEFVSGCSNRIRKIFREGYTTPSIVGEEFMKELESNEEKKRNNEESRHVVVFIYRQQGSDVVTVPYEDINW